MDNRHNGVNLNRSEITKIVISSLQEVLELREGNSPDPENIGIDTHLFGHDALLDSMGLVTLIVEIEQHLEEAYDVVLVLADDRAMSMENSPFRSVQSLTGYICRLLEEQD